MSKLSAVCERLYAMQCVGTMTEVTLALCLENVWCACSPFEYKSSVTTESGSVYASTTQTPITQGLSHQIADQHTWTLSHTHYKRTLDDSLLNDCPLPIANKPFLLLQSLRIGFWSYFDLSCPSDHFLCFCLLCLKTFLDCLLNEIKLPQWNEWTSISMIRFCCWDCFTKPIYWLNCNYDQICIFHNNIMCYYVYITTLTSISHRFWHFIKTFSVIDL